MRPKLSLMPYIVTIDFAMLVACSMSFCAPVVTSPKTSSSAALPPRVETSRSSSSFFDMR